MLKKIIVLLCTLSVILPLTATSAQESSATTNKYGVHLLLDDGRSAWPLELWESHMQAAAAFSGESGYVTQVVRLDNLEPDRWQYFLNLCDQYQLQPLIRLATIFDHERGAWSAPPQDDDGRYVGVATQFATFFAALDWQHITPRFVVHNEPNHGTEWGGRPQPAEYARYLVDVATALHMLLPDAVVLNAGFDHYAPHTGNQPF